MIRRITLATAFCGALLLGGAQAGEPEPGSLLVIRARVEFKSRSDLPNSNRATVLLRAHYAPLDGVPYFRTDGVAVEITIAGQAYRIDTTDEGVRLGNLSTRLRFKRPRSAPREGLRSLFIDAVKGTVRARIDAPDADALRATGAWNVPISLRTGDVCFERSIDLRSARQTRRAIWRQRAKDTSSRPITYQGNTPSVTSAREQRNVVVRDASAWLALWVENGGKPQTLPAVDFQVNAVVGVFLGGRTGVTLSIDRALPIADGLIIRFTEHTPGRNCVVAQVVTFPFAFAKIPAGNDQVLFKGRVHRENCGR